MKALVLSAQNPLRVRGWPQPTVRIGDLLIRPIAVGICVGDRNHCGGRIAQVMDPLPVTGLGRHVARQWARCGP